LDSFQSRIKMISYFSQSKCHSLILIFYLYLLLKPSYTIIDERSMNKQWTLRFLYIPILIIYTLYYIYYLNLSKLYFLLYVEIIFFILLFYSLQFFLFFFFILILLIFFHSFVDNFFIFLSLFLNFGLFFFFLNIWNININLSNSKFKTN